MLGAENFARLSLTDPQRFTPERIAEFVADLVAAVTQRQPA
jgi:hypothetical protein